MEKLAFIGLEKRESKKGNNYFLLHYGRNIEQKNGIGLKPYTSVIDDEDADEFKELDLGIVFEGKIDTTQTVNGSWKYTLVKYKL